LLPATKPEVERKLFIAETSCEWREQCIELHSIRRESTSRTLKSSEQYEMLFESVCAI